MAVPAPDKKGMHAQVQRVHPRKATGRVTKRQAGYAAGLAVEVAGAVPEAPAFGALLALRIWRI